VEEMKEYDTTSCSSVIIYSDMFDLGMESEDDFLWEGP
jgi:hypothetical protein